MDVILRAAARVFAAQGYAAGTTNRIAEAAGVSVGSLYEYFPNKDALLVALMEAHVAEGRALLEAMVALHARDRALHRVLFEEAPLPPRLRRQLADAERAIAVRVAAYLAGHPEVTVPDPVLAATVVVQAVEAVTHKLVVHGGEDDVRAQAAELVALVVAYLTADRRRS